MHGHEVNMVPIYGDLQRDKFQNLNQLDQEEPVNTSKELDCGQMVQNSALSDLLSPAGRTLL